MALLIRCAASFYHDKSNVKSDCRDAVCEARADQVYGNDSLQNGPFGHLRRSDALQQPSH